MMKMEKTQRIIEGVVKGSPGNGRIKTARRLRDSAAWWELPRDGRGRMEQASPIHSLVWVLGIAMLRGFIGI